MRGLSQRALGDRMGLGKEKGSSRINRYENKVTAIGFDNLNVIAEILDVPVAYLLAENAAMADAILALAQASATNQASLAKVLEQLAASPALSKALAKALRAAPENPRAVIDALQTVRPPPKPTKPTKRR